ncbi:hypothetical protein BB561_005035 [Smittium simulii]|uniref:phosphoribosylglycinamide formyltransferase 1 n=1 Tax=Smittium simulii TaxID=133385 RepID=A0A2T9YCK2_9FUNG|nr:hypothetical protein BB561_005035 [Smittium simulii]
MPKRIVVLISGSGSNLQAIIDSITEKKISGQIVHVFSSKASAYGLERAQKANIPTSIVSLKDYKDKNLSREEFNKDLARSVTLLNPDLVVLAGWMLILSESFVESFKNILINLHPALPGDIEGANAIERAYDEFILGKRTKTGVMVHHVIAQVDRGEMILSEEIPIEFGDSLKDLENKIHAVEHKLLPLAIEKLLTQNN